MSIDVKAYLAESSYSEHQLCRVSLLLFYQYRRDKCSDCQPTSHQTTLGCLDFQNLELISKVHPSRPKRTEKERKTSID